MLVAHNKRVEKLEALVGLIDNISVDPDVQIDYYIPDVVTTVNKRNTSDDPYVQFTYEANGQRPQVQYMPLKDNYLQKTPEDLANLVTFAIARFTEEIDSTFYGAQ